MVISCYTETVWLLLWIDSPMSRIWEITEKGVKKMKYDMQDKERIVNNVNPTPVYLSDSFRSVGMKLPQTLRHTHRHTHTHICFTYTYVCCQMHTPYCTCVLLMHMHSGDQWREFLHTQCLGSRELTIASRACTFVWVCVCISLIRGFAEGPFVLEAIFSSFSFSQ